VEVAADVVREDRSLRSAWQKVLQAGNAEEAATEAAGLIAAAERGDWAG